MLDLGVEVLLGNRVDASWHAAIPSNNRMDYTEAAPEPSSKVSASANAADPKTGLIRGISLTDATLLLVGGIIGTGIFLTSGDVAAATHTPLVFLAAWVAGMLVSWLASVSV